MFDHCTKLMRAYGRSEQGAVAIVAGLCLIPMLLAVGLAVDFARIYHVDSKLTGAIDAASLAAAKALRDGATDAKVRDVALAYFDDNMKGGARNYVNIKSVDVDIDRPRNAVSIDVTSEVRTIIFQIAGPAYTKINVPKSSVAIFENKDIELGLQIDVTGSMGQPSGSGGSKMDALKDAVGDLLDILLPAGGTTNKVRIGLAPFSSGVNAGSYAAAVSGGRAGADGCVYERRDLAAQATDIAPSGPGAKPLKARSDLSGALACPSSARIVALTDNKTLLRDTVRSWLPDGYTAGHLGAAWAWHLVSENWSAIWPSASRPAPYGDGKTQKVVILMTDGEYNTFGGRNGREADSKRYAQSTCEAIRTAGVVVYTIGFKVSTAQEAELKACAGTVGNFYAAENGESLRQAFRAIAEEINNLRLSS